MIQKLTDIDLEAEALQASKCRNVETALKEQAYISTRDARAHQQLAGMKPGRQRTIASRGELSLHDVASAIVEHYGPFEVLTLATWAASEEAIKRLIALRQAGGVQRLEALVDTRMPTDCSNAHAMMKSEFSLYACGSNHAKVMAFTGGPKRYGPSVVVNGGGGIAIVSTANLTRNPRCEVMVVSRDNTLAEFHRDWIREEIAHAEK